MGEGQQPREDLPSTGTTASFSAATCSETRGDEISALLASQLYIDEDNDDGATDALCMRLKALTLDAGYLHELCAEALEEALDRRPSEVAKNEPNWFTGNLEITGNPLKSFRRLQTPEDLFNAFCSLARRGELGQEKMRDLFEDGHLVSLEECEELFVGDMSVSEFYQIAKSYIGSLTGSLEG